MATLTTLSASGLRRTLANAHAAFLAKSNALPCLALEEVLRATRVVTEEAFLVNVTMAGTTICCQFEDEVIELDAYGNFLRGAV